MIAATVPVVYHQSANVAALSYVETSPLLDGSATVTLQRKTDRNAAGNVFGVAMRVRDDEVTYYRFVFNDATSDQFRLEKVVAGTVTTLGAPVSASSTGVDTSITGPPFTVSIVCDGSRISGLVNSVEVVYDTDTDIEDAGYAGIASYNNQQGGQISHTIFTGWELDEASDPVTPDRIAITAQPASAVDVGQPITVVAAAQDASGNTDTTYAIGTWKLRARSAPTGWDLSTVLDSDTPVAGVVALSATVPMEGAWVFGVDDDDDALADSDDSDAVTASLPSGGTSISGGALADMDLLKGGGADRRTLLYQAADDTGAPKTDLTGKPSISINGGTASTTPAASDASHVGGGVYAVELSDSSLTAGDYIVVTGHSTARITPAVGRVVAVDVATEPLEEDAIAAAVLDLEDGVEGSVTMRQALRGMLAALVGKLTGAAGTTVTIRDVGDTTDRITATVDEDGNRSAVTLNLD